MDLFLEEVGEFGSYQVRNFILLSLPTVVVAMQKLAWVFLAAKMNHRCKLPWENASSPYDLQDDELDLYYPKDVNSDNGYSQCKLYSIVYEEDPFNSTSDVKACEEFIYDTSEYETSAVIDYNMVCNRAWIRAMVQSFFMVGMLVGSYAFGDFSDRVGRKPVFLSAISFLLVVGIGQVVVLNIVFFTILRFVLGATLQGIFLIAYVIMMEMVGKTKRVVVGILAHAFYSIAFFTGALIAYLVTSWRWLQVAYTLPVIIFIPYYWLISESARWLSAKGRSTEAKSVLIKVARANHKQVSECSLENAIKIPEGKSNGNFFDLFRYQSLRTKTLIFFLGWMVNSGVYYGLSLNTSDLGGNDYINFMISGAVEIPGLLFACFIIEKVGRKMPLCALMSVGGIALLIGILLRKGSIALTVLAMIGKMCITGSYAIIYTFTTESFPTVVRNVALGSSSMVARVGGALAPYINLLGTHWPPLPFLIFGLSSLASGMLCLILDETKGNPMPDLIQEKIHQPEEVKLVKEEKSNGTNVS
ncbi:UNVERIFIED_CONTAM: hypothetical protein RMT77_012848 [Armadillidium vulgare]